MLELPDRSNKRLPKCETFPNKLIFYTLEKAWMKAWDVYKTYGNEVSPYQCYGCRWYHLTSVAKKVPDWLVEIINKEVAPNNNKDEHKTI